MEMQFFNFLYFAWAAVVLFALFAVHFVMRKMPRPLKHLVVFILTLVPVAALIARPIFYSDPSGAPWYRMLFPDSVISWCAILLPLAYIGKSRFFKSGAVFVGIAVGLLGVFVPAEILGTGFGLDMIRHYVQYGLVFIVPVLMLSLGLYEVKLRDVVTVPLYAMMIMAFVLCADVMLFEAGLIAEYGNAAWQFAPIEGIDLNWIIPEFFREPNFFPILWAGVPVFAAMIPLSITITALYMLLYRKVNKVK